MCEWTCVPACLLCSVFVKARGARASHRLCESITVRVSDSGSAPSNKARRERVHDMRTNLFLHRSFSLVNTIQAENPAVTVSDPIQPADPLAEDVKSI